MREETWTVYTNRLYLCGAVTGISAGWGWGMSSYGGNVSINYNRLINVMQLLDDGGCVYTNAPYMNSSVSYNYCSGDPKSYGAMYHVSNEPCCVSRYAMHTFWRCHYSNDICITRRITACFSVLETLLIM